MGYLIQSLCGTNAQQIPELRIGVYAPCVLCVRKTWAEYGNSQKTISLALWVVGGRRREIRFGTRGWTQLAVQLKAFSK
jgi:hypothetical protein